MMARKAGTVVLTGIERFDSTVTLPQFESRCAASRCTAVRTGECACAATFRASRGCSRTAWVDAKPIITRRYPLDEINDALRAAEKRENLTRRDRSEPLMHAFPRPSSRTCPSSDAGRGSVPGVRRRQPRRVPRAQRGRLVGRAQMPGVPRLAAARAGPLFGVYVPLGLEILRGDEALDARRRRRRHVHRRRLGPRRAHRGGEGAERPVRPGRAGASRAHGGWASRAGPSSTTRARWASTR